MGEELFRILVEVEGEKFGLRESDVGVRFLMFSREGFTEHADLDWNELVALAIIEEWILFATEGVAEIDTTDEACADFVFVEVLAKSMVGCECRNTTGVSLDLLDCLAGIGTGLRLGLGLEDDLEKVPLNLRGKVGHVHLLALEATDDEFFGIEIDEGVTGLTFVEEDGLATIVDIETEMM